MHRGRGGGEGENGSGRWKKLNRHRATDGQNGGRSQVPLNSLQSKFNWNGWITGSFVSFFFHSVSKGHHCNCQTHLHVVILQCLCSLCNCYFSYWTQLHNADIWEGEIKWSMRLWIYTFVACMDNTCVLFSPVRYKLEWSRWMGTKEATQWCDWGEKKSLGECQCTVRVEYAKTLQNTYCDFNDLWETSLLLSNSSSKRLTSPACWESQELNINYMKWMSGV